MFLILSPFHIFKQLWWNTYFLEENLTVIFNLSQILSSANYTLLFYFCKSSLL